MAAGSVVGYAVSARGYDAHKPDLNDGGVWVTDSRLSSFGRINKPIGQLDAIVYSDDRSDVDILQQDSAVVGVNFTTRRLSVIDPTTGTPAEGREASLPRASEVQLAGGTIATLDPVKGSVWATRVAPEGALPDLSRIDADLSPLTEAGANAGLAVTQGGAVLVASSDTDTLTRIEPAGAELGTPTSQDITLEGLPAVTAVGDVPIVLDQETGQLTVIGGARAVVEVGAVLQQPGPAADAVLLETSTALISVDLESGALTTVATVPAGSPTAPVRLGSCDFAAWSGGRGYVTSRCDDAEPTTLTLDHHTSDLVFRVNRGQILLNDRLSGAVWNIDETPTQIDNWEAFRNPNSDNDKSSEQQNEDPGDRRPPKARNDHFGTRPGRTTVTHPLDNDSAPAGRMLAVSSVEQLTGEAAPATISPDGQTVQIQQPGNATGVATYAYYISDGRHDVGAHAKITVEVRKRGNAPPQLRPGFKTDTWPVAPNGTVTLPVLTDWRDPADGDALDVVAAKVTSAIGEGAAVQTTTDGRLRFTAPNEPGQVTLSYGVTDGRSAPVTQEMSFKIQDPDTDNAVAASAQPDIVTAQVGEWVTIRPLANDLPGADPLSPDARLQLAAAVTSPKGAQTSTDLSQGTVTFRAPEARSYFLDYDVSYGDAPLASGRIRVDVHERERRGPVAMPDTATIFGASPAMVDVLANDNDPRGGVLMVQSVTADSDQLDVAVVDGRWVRVNARAGELRPRTQLVRYVISNGSQSATGEIQVTQRPVPEDNMPVTEPDRVTVRAGSSLTVPVLDNDFSPAGDQLALVSDVAGQDSGRLEALGPDGRQRDNGDAFVSGRLVRYVAPETVPAAETVTVTYIAQNAAGKTAPGTLQITVLPPSKRNQPPEAPIIEGRVVAGDTITLRLPGSGIDPDGDAVTVMGLGSAPSLGRVMALGANSIDYQAYPSSTGTDEFNYLIEDAQGGRATGTIRVAVVPPGALQPPLAVADEITVEPGREATVYPMSNDFVSPGDRVDVELVDPPAGVSLVGDVGPVKISTAGLEAGRDVVVVYRLDDGVETTQSTITVHTATPFNNPPVVFDAFGATTDSAAVRVDVLKGAYDPDGPSRQLRVAEVYAEDARVNGSRITVLRSEQPRVVAFRVEDADGGATMANLYVPPTGTDLPYVKPGAVIHLDPGQQRKLSVATYVVNPSGGPVTLTDGAELIGSPPGLVSSVGL
ncbi:MAG: Ig-like domain-containing protein, partial [Nocardioidaceae bacterium]